jgi:hypothetical protein
MNTSAKRGLETGQMKWQILYKKLDASIVDIERENVKVEQFCKSLKLLTIHCIFSP